MAPLSVCLFPSLLFFLHKLSSCWLRLAKVLFIFFSFLSANNHPSSLGERGGVVLRMLYWVIFCGELVGFFGGSLGLVKGNYEL